METKRVEDEGKYDNKRREYTVGTHTLPYSHSHSHAHLASFAPPHTSITICRVVKAAADLLRNASQTAPKSHRENWTIQTTRCTLVSPPPPPLARRRRRVLTPGATRRPAPRPGTLPQPPPTTRACWSPPVWGSLFRRWTPDRPVAVSSPASWLQHATLNCVRLQGRQ